MPDIDRLVVAIDGSEMAREAFEYAAVLAEAAGMHVCLLHVIEETAPDGIVGREARLELPAVEEIVRSAQMFCGLHGIESSTRFAEGRLVDILTEESSPSDIVCVGMKGRFARSGLGSTTRWLVNHAPCPVMIVSGPALRPLNRVIGVYDGTPSSRRAVDLSRQLSVRARWPQTVLAVAERGLSLDRALDEAQQLAPAAQVIAFEARGRSEAEQIEDAAARARHAIFAVGAYADSLFHQLLFGGTTGHLLGHLRAPVLLVHQAGHPNGAGSPR